MAFNIIPVSQLGKYKLQQQQTTTTTKNGIGQEQSNHVIMDFLSPEFVQSIGQRTNTFSESDIEKVRACDLSCPRINWETLLATGRRAGRATTVWNRESIQLWGCERGGSVVQVKQKKWIDSPTRGRLCSVIRCWWSGTTRGFPFSHYDDDCYYVQTTPKAAHFYSIREMEILNYCTFTSHWWLGLLQGREKRDTSGGGRVGCGAEMEAIHKECCNLMKRNWGAFVEWEMVRFLAHQVPALPCLPTHSIREEVDNNIIVGQKGFLFSFLRHE